MHQINDMLGDFDQAAHDLRACLAILSASDAYRNRIHAMRILADLHFSLRTAQMVLGHWNNPVIERRER